MDRSAAIRDIAGALQGSQNQCAFLMVDNAVFRFRHASTGGTVLLLAAVTRCHLFSQWRGNAF